jgi:hypothetical protein
LRIETVRFPQIGPNYLWRLIFRPGSKPAKPGPARVPQ